MKQIKTHAEGKEYANKQKRVVVCEKDGKQYKYYPRKRG